LILHLLATYDPPKVGFDINICKKMISNPEAFSRGTGGGWKARGGNKIK